MNFQNLNLMIDSIHRFIAIPYFKKKSQETMPIFAERLREGHHP